MTRCLIHFSNPKRTISSQPVFHQDMSDDRLQTLPTSQTTLPLSPQENREYRRLKSNNYKHYTKPDQVNLKINHLQKEP